MSERKSATKWTREATAPLAEDAPGATSVGIRELRDHLSRYLDLVKGGAPVTITDHGRVIATIVPLRFPERTMELYRQGKVNLPTLPKGNPADFHRTNVEGGVQDILKDIRGG